MEKAVTARFFDFCEAFVRLYFPRLTGNEDLSLETFLAQSSYSKAQQDRIYAMVSDRDGRIGLTEKDYRTESFGKFEGYDSFKFMRCINAYNDRIKALFGPYIHAADEAIFSKLPFFAKHLTMNERARKLQQLFGNEPVMMTDFTSFEAHHRGRFADVVYLVFSHVLAPVAPRELLRVLHELIKGVNITQLPGVKVAVNERLMSGAQWTSSANSVLNMFICLFLVASSEKPSLGVEDLARYAYRIPALFEGDDGITQARDVDVDLIRRLGLKLKMELHPHFGLGSFCGVVTDPQSGTVVTDPRKVLADFPVFPYRYVTLRSSKRLGLLRAKAMSYLYCYPACPIVSELARLHLRLTSGIDVRCVTRFFDWYQRETLLKAVATPDMHLPIDNATRNLVSARYGISPQQQVEIEKYLATKSDLSALDITLDWPQEWLEFAQYYCVMPGCSQADYARTYLLPGDLPEREHAWSTLRKRRRSCGWRVCDGTRPDPLWPGGVKVHEPP